MAHYMHNGFVVYHGSLLFGTDLEEMVKITAVSKDKISSKDIKTIGERVTNISDHLQEPIGTQQFKELMVKSLLGATGSCYKLNAEEIRRVKEIAEEKFHNWDGI